VGPGAEHASGRWKSSRLLKKPRGSGGFRLTFVAIVYRRYNTLLNNNEPAIRKCYRKEMQITMKSEAVAKAYVIENEVVRG